MKWRIVVPNYGDFTFDGTEEEAEEKRTSKSGWMAIAHKHVMGNGGDGYCGTCRPEVGLG